MAKKVLIIDDEPELCQEITQYLSELGYEAHQAHNGAEGLALLETLRPNLLLLDIRMPNMDGLQVLKQIVKKFSHIVVVILTGVQDVEIARRAIEYGACEYVTKPIGLEELSEKVIRPLVGAPME